MAVDLLPLLQTSAPADEFGSPIVALLFLILACIVVVGSMGVAAAISGVILAVVGAATVAAIVIGSLLAAAFCLHLTLATIVWTRRPRTRVWMSKRWWGLTTLLAGFAALVPFWWLHYVRSPIPRCHGCGYDLRGRAITTAPAGMCLLCPECGEPRR